MIEFKQVSKRFGSVVALDGVNIHFPKGSICGLFGPNGAGKSTIMKLITGINYPDQGEVKVRGASPKAQRQLVAYLPEVDHLYPWWNLAQAARFMSVFYPDWDEGRCKELLSFLRLDEGMILGKISKGQRAKAKLLMVLSRRAPYLLLDEPFSGIDLLTREEIAHALIKGYREGEQTLIISTHEIDEIESLVDQVVFIDQGRIQLQSDAEQLRMERNKSLVEIMKEVFRNGSQQV
ncbi:MAG: ABC transporter ATP-binding protein [Syntrophomonadaceae bacterium]|nr:ABC transporter ATP-binding protein [Syntrophomonadaceae bacterium]